MNILKTVAVFILISVTPQTIAHDQGDTIEQAINYRQSAFRMIAWHFKPMGAMVKEKIDWNLADFQDHANAVAALARLPINGFIPDSDFGDTHAKSIIWEEPDDFAKKMQAFVDQAGNLQVIAQNGDRDQISDQFIQTARTCKSCHKKYREKN